MLIFFVGFYSIKGFFKGFVSMLFSLISVMVIAVLSWSLSEGGAEVLKNLPFVQNDLYNIIENSLNSVIPEKFSNMESLLFKVENSPLNVFVVFFIKMFAKDIYFEGEANVGQVFAPVFHDLLIKVFSFVLIFLLFFILSKILNIFLNRLVNIVGLSVLNRMFGAVLGFFKGVLIFGILYVVFFSIATFSANEVLISHLQNAKISSFVYENIFKNFIDLFR